MCSNTNSRRIIKLNWMELHWPHTTDRYSVEWTKRQQNNMKIIGSSRRRPRRINRCNGTRCLERELALLRNAKMHRNERFVLLLSFSYYHFFRIVTILIGVRCNIFDFLSHFTLRFYLWFFPLSSVLVPCSSHRKEAMVGGKRTYGLRNKRNSMRFAIGRR